MRASLIFKADIKNTGSWTVTDRSVAIGSDAGLGSDFCVPSHLLVSISSIVTWILAEVPAGGHVGFDPFLLSVGRFYSRSLDLFKLLRRVALPPGRYTNIFAYKEGQYGHRVS